MNIDADLQVTDSGKVSIRKPVAAAGLGGDSVVAVVKWIRADKGYGFISLNDGQGDAFLHVMALRGLRLDTAPKGATVRVQLQDDPHGRQVTRVLELDFKWYDAIRGFGSVAGDDFGRDIGFARPPPSRRSPSSPCRQAAISLSIRPLRPPPSPAQGRLRASVRAVQAP